jgi:hypothetical protein
MTRIIWLLALWLLAVIDPPSPRYVGPAKWTGSATNKPIKRITIHATVGGEPGLANAAENVVAYSKKTTRPSSYHYIADAYKSLQYVYDSIVAYHAPPNEGSLGYELCCSLSNSGKGHWSDRPHQKMLRIAAKDIARLCLAYDIPIVKLSPLALRLGKKGIAGHHDVSLAWRQTSHWDPGPYFPWKQFITLVKAEADLLLNPEEPTRGAAVDHAIADLMKAARRAAEDSPRRRKIKAALADLRSIKAA